ncbi:MAG: membrane protein insertase YidC [Gammaproteobacteria bacterium]|nr:membrane protein insertase YidC [Gammaproteobacteria bacterium]
MMPTISPEVQRIVLLVALGITGYLMILAWNQDYMQPQPATERASAPQLDGAALSGPGPASAAVPASDIPDASFIGAPDPAADQAVAPAGDAGAAERLIRVATPSQEVWIDRRGGDIRRVHLPRYPVNLEQPDLPFELLDVGNRRTYMAQSGLIGPDGLDSGSERPLYRTARANYEVGDGETLAVELEAEAGDVKVQKVFIFQGGDYLVDVIYRVENRGAEPFRASLFGQIKRDAKEPPGQESFSLGPQPYLGAALTTPDSRYEKIEFEDLDEGDFRDQVEGGWIAFLQHYFLSAWIANEGESNSYYGRKRADGTYIVGYTSPLTAVAPGDQGEWRSRFYAGPKDQKRLEQIADNLNLTVDYGFLWWLAVPLFALLDWLHGLVGNWGVAIILLTVLVKLVLYPLSSASYKSMANMRRVAPQMKRLQERHAGDRQKLSQEMMGLYKKEGVNPLGGCLPMLLPMPIFIALYWVLFESVELRQAPFALWIDDLAAMDPYFILPLLMGATMYVQQLLSPTMGDPMQARIMKLMPIMFTVLFLFFPAGLVLYWLVNSVLSVAQQWYVMKKTEAAAVPARN